MAPATRAPRAGSSRAWASHACAKAYPPPIGTGLSIPRGLYDLLLRIKNDYPNYKKIYITENGMGYKDDFGDGFTTTPLRIDYMRQHLAWILKAIDGGVNVDGYFVMVAAGPVLWTNGCNKRLWPVLHRL